MTSTQTLVKTSTRTKVNFRKIEPFLYLAPATILIVLIFLYPIVDIVRTSLLQNNPDGIKTVGVTNYR
jgi:ABC-type sugar transport system permease subunit